jgi:hypothetical protein
MEYFLRQFQIAVFPFNKAWKQFQNGLAARLYPQLFATIDPDSQQNLGAPVVC